MFYGYVVSLGESVVGVVFDEGEGVLGVVGGVLFGFWFGGWGVGCVFLALFLFWWVCVVVGVGLCFVDFVYFYGFVLFLVGEVG